MLFLDSQPMAALEALRRLQSAARGTSRDGNEAHHPLGIDMAAGQAALFQILLVVVFRGVKRNRRDNLRRDRFGIAVRLLQRLFRSLGLRLLLGRMEKNRGAVLRTPVRALAVDLGGIVVFPENFQQVGIGDFGGIELDFDGFGVARAIGTDFLIGWVFRLAAGVADAG